MRKRKLLENGRPYATPLSASTLTLYGAEISRLSQCRRRRRTEHTVLTTLSFRFERLKLPDGLKGLRYLSLSVRQ